MPQKVVQSEQHILGIALVQNPTDASLPAFLNACESNDAAIALQLAPDCEAGLLTYGLNRAVRENHLDLARQLLGVGATWDTETVRHASRSLDAVKFLVESGFDVNTSLIEGLGLLGLAVGYNDEACIRYLLEHGANPNLGPPLITQGPRSQIRPVSNSGRTLNRAAMYCTPEIFALLLSYGAEISNAIPLHYAAGSGPSPANPSFSSRIPMLDYLFALGLDVNAVDDAIKIADDGRQQTGTPLQYVIKWGGGGVEQAKWLLDRGADPDKKTPWGFSARDDAKRSIHPDHELAILFRSP